MGVNASNLLMGPATLYKGVFGAVEPADSQGAVNAIPPVSAWTDMGGTQGGATLTVSQGYTALEVDQVVDRAGSRLTSRTAMVKTNLAEATLDNLAMALNASAPVTGTGFKTYDPPNDSSATQPGYYAVILDGFAPGGSGLTPFRRRVILRKVLSVEDVDLAYSKDGQTLIPVTFQCHYVSASVGPYHWIDQTA